MSHHFAIFLLLATTSMAAGDQSEFFPMHEGNRWSSRWVRDGEVIPDVGSITIVGSCAIRESSRGKVARDGNWTNLFSDGQDYSKWALQGNIGLFLNHRFEHVGSPPDTLLVRFSSGDGVVIGAYGTTGLGSDDPGTWVILAQDHIWYPELPDEFPYLEVDDLFFRVFFVHALASWLLGPDLGDAPVARRWPGRDFYNVAVSVTQVTDGGSDQWWLENVGLVRIDLVANAYVELTNATVNGTEVVPRSTRSASPTWGQLKQDSLP